MAKAKTKAKIKGSEEAPTSKGRGRPEGPCTSEELWQRRSASWKNGQRATTAILRVVPPCRRKDCRADDYPCGPKRAAKKAGGVMEVCWPSLGVDEDVLQRYRRALDGDLDGPKDLAARALTLQYQLYDVTGTELLHDGMTVEHYMVSPDGEILQGKDGPVVIKVTRNPAVDAWLRLGEQLGVTGRDQAVTPASRSEQVRDESFGTIAEFMTTRLSTTEEES